MGFCFISDGRSRRSSSDELRDMIWMDHGFIDIQFRITFSHHAFNARFYIATRVSSPLLPILHVKRFPRL